MSLPCCNVVEKPDLTAVPCEGTMTLAPTGAEYVCGTCNGRCGSLVHPLHEEDPMPNHHDHLFHRARAFSGADNGETHAEGVIVAVADFATFTIETADGTLVHWGTHLTEIGPEVSEEEMARIRQSRELRKGFAARTVNEQEATVAVDAAARALHAHEEKIHRDHGFDYPAFDALPPLEQNAKRETVLPLVWAALQALPDRDPRVDTLRSIVIETPTAEEWLLPEYGGEYGEITAYHANRDKMPEAFAVALEKVNEDVDAAQCGLSTLNDQTNGQMCSNAIGWVLHEPEDYGDSGGLEWRWTTLVDTGRGVVAVCEECDPHNLYENVWDNQNPPS